MASDNATSIAEALFGKKQDEVWQDREIKFDAAPVMLQYHRGEDVLEVMEPVEDTKGNNGEPGKLMLTNLRLIWISNKQQRTNISIGHNTITSISVKPATSRLKGNASAVYVLTKVNQQRFEFIFTVLATSSSSLQLPAAMQTMLAAYEASRPYRELKLRGALLVGKELKLLPRETAYSRVNGVWNLSSDTGNLGTFIITNIRIVWYSVTSLSFNVSIPYLQTKSVRLCESKFGPALVIETSSSSGAYVLGFRIDPKETLEYVHKECSSLLQAYLTNPIFGVEYEAVKDLQGAAPHGAIDDQTEILETEQTGDAWAAYYADDDGARRDIADPVYSVDLGLAIEPPKDGATIQQLWSIL